VTFELLTVYQRRSSLNQSSSNLTIIIIIIIIMINQSINQFICQVRQHSKYNEQCMVAGQQGS